MSNTVHKIRSLNIGKIEQLTYGDKIMSTAIRKQPVHDNIYLTKTGLLGDEQAYKGHGGIDKALCLYSYNHYPYWQDKLNVQIDHALFGENITVYGMLEDMVHVGDLFQFGEAVIQITEPRTPCSKLATRYDYKSLPIDMQQNGFTGFYCRVLQEGNVSISSDLKLIKYHPQKISIAQINSLKFQDKTNKELLEQILSVDEISAELREHLVRQYGKLAN